MDATAAVPAHHLLCAAASANERCDIYVFFLFWGEQEKGKKYANKQIGTQTKKKNWGVGIWAFWNGFFDFWCFFFWVSILVLTGVFRWHGGTLVYNNNPFSHVVMDNEQRHGGAFWRWAALLFSWGGIRRLHGLGWDGMGWGGIGGFYANSWVFCLFLVVDYLCYCSFFNSQKPLCAASFILFSVSFIVFASWIGWMGFLLFWVVYSETWKRSGSAVFCFQALLLTLCFLIFNPVLFISSFSFLAFERRRRKKNSCFFFSFSIIKWG